MAGGRATGALGRTGGERGRRRRDGPILRHPTAIMRNQRITSTITRCRRRQSRRRPSRRARARAGRRLAIRRRLRTREGRRCIRSSIPHRSLGRSSRSSRNYSRHTCRCSRRTARRRGRFRRGRSSSSRLRCAMAPGSGRHRRPFELRPQAHPARRRLTRARRPLHAHSCRLLRRPRAVRTPPPPPPRPHDRRRPHRPRPHRPHRPCLESGCTLRWLGR